MGKATQGTPLPGGGIRFHQSSMAHTAPQYNRATGANTPHSCGACAWRAEIQDPESAQFVAVVRALMAAGFCPMAPAPQQCAGCGHISTQGHGWLYSNFMPGRSYLICCAGKVPGYPGAATGQYNAPTWAGVPRP